MSAVQLASVGLEEGELVFNVNLTVGQVRRMSASEGDLDAIIGVLSSIVHSWPFEGDPSDAESWDDLTMPQFNSVAAAITGELGKGQE